MSFLKRLAAVELVAQISLVTCASLFALILALVGLGGAESVNTVAYGAAGLAFVVYVSGVISVVIVGAPVYAILEARRLATTFTAVLVGALPGVVLLVASWISSKSMFKSFRLNITPEYALIYIVLGMTVGATTHLLRTWNTGFAMPPDTSLEQTRDK